MKKEISVKESFDYFITTLDRYDCSHLKLKDNELLHIILSELDIEAVSFLHHNTVDNLVKCNLIPSNVTSSIDELRNKTLFLLQYKRDVNDIRNDSEWNYVRHLADEIKNKILNSKKAEI